MTNKLNYSDNTGLDSIDFELLLVLLFDLLTILLLLLFRGRHDVCDNCGINCCSVGSNVLIFDWSGNNSDNSIFVINEYDEIKIYTINWIY